MFSILQRSSLRQNPIAPIAQKPRYEAKEIRDIAKNCELARMPSGNCGAEKKEREMNMRWEWQAFANRRMTDECRRRARVGGSMNIAG